MPEASNAQPHSAQSEMDAVYTWVDDTFPGYAETLREYASDKRDLNPNRTRDNLDLLKYSLRSLEKNAPFVRRVHLLTCRPQVPDWLNADHPDLRLVHHDAVMDPAILPTFNSFAIVSHLAKLPELSGRFLYFEDDMLAFTPFQPEDFVNADGLPRIFAKDHDAPVHERLNPETESPWNLALATANAALDRSYSKKRRKFLAHGPRLIDRALFEEMCATFPAEIEATRGSRFRANGNVPPEYLYPQFLLETKRAELATAAQTRRMTGYASLENILPWTWFQLTRLERRRPATVTLNDSFNNRPNPRVVAYVRRTLERWFPAPSRFEK